ncbi:MAG TPA: hypothetical protein VK426_11455, partial [Methanobacterium sp.]|nr:hypothetical protein [Methanobacterium sp.]
MKAKYIIITIFILIAGVAAYLWPNLNNQSNETFVGSDNSGFVTKETYSHLGAFGPKIAIITGMHSREISAKN